MTAQISFAEFEASLGRESHPPVRLSVPLRALWLEGKGDWSGAHALAQAADLSKNEARDGAWVHAHLHRKEEDAANAAYWYARAGRPVATGDLAAEWREIAATLLKSAESG